MHNTVDLIEGGRKQTFNLLHAQNILQLQEREHIPDRFCWKLPADSPFEYVNHELILKKDDTGGGKKNTRKAGKR